MAVIVGTFESEERAQGALAQLRAAGFDDADIALVSGKDGETTDVPGKKDPRRGDSALPVASFAGATGAIIGGAMFGPVGAILGGLAAGGSFGAALTSRGMTEDELREYESYVHQGRYTLAVATTSRDAEAWRILKEAGASNVRDRT